MSAEFVASFHPGQMAIHLSEARFKIVAAGRRFGKSHYAALELIIASLLSENKWGQRLGIEAGVYYVAPTFDQAKRIMWPKIRELAGYERTGGLIRNENVNEGWIEMISGRKIYIRGADNPDSLRGIALHYVVLDEYADMKENVWSEIIEPALMDYQGEALFIGTPKGKNHFYKIFMKALHYKYDPETEEYPLFEAFHFKSGDNPFILKSELKRMMNSDTSSRETVRQEIEADFVSGGGKILKPGDFIVVERGPSVSGRQGRYYITCDLAGFIKEGRNKIMRSDESVICTTWVEDDTGDWYVCDMQHGRWDSREVALRIVKTCNKFYGCRLGIESGITMYAVEPYLDDYMREFGRFITVEPLKHGGVNKYSRIEWALQGRSQRGKIKLVKGDWNEWFLDQCSDFPDKLAHDDGLDALAYCDQMSNVIFSSSGEEWEEWEPLDPDSGY
jgi:predicted phage terminase large subunit-like protein